MKNEQHQYKAAIYARYSSSGQREESIEGQVRECKAFAERNNIIIVKIYADKATSGTSTEKRLQFQQMMRDSEKGIFDAVICWKIDRFARNRYDSAMNKYKLKRNGIRLFYAKESIPEGPEGIILESVMEGYAEYYSENLSQNVKRGNYESALKCQTLGRKLLGYKKGPEGTYEIDPETAPAVRYMFEQYSKGVGEVDIINQLNSMGYHTSTGGPFKRGSVTKIIKSERYLGIYTYQDKIRIEGGLPALVSQEVFEQCQRIIKRNRQAPRAAKGNAVGRYILTGKLFCGKCGSTMVAGTGTSRSGKKYGYYQCSAKMKHKCDKKQVKKEWIEDLVIDKLIQIIHNDEFLNYVSDKVVEYENKILLADDNDAIDHLKNQRRNTIKARDNIIKAIEGGLISDALQDRYKQLEAEIATLNSLIISLQKEHTLLSKEQILYYLKQFRNLSNEAMEKNIYRERLIDTFLNSVFLYENEIVIMLNYSGNNNTLTLSAVESALKAQTLCSNSAIPSPPETPLTDVRGSNNKE